MKTETLKQLIQNEEVINNVKLKEELERMLNYQYGDESIFISDILSFDSYQYLINHGLSPDALLKDALNFNTSYDQSLLEKQEQLIKLAFEYKANPNSISYFSKLPSLNILKQLLEHGFNANKALNTILSLSTTKYDSIAGQYINDEEAIELQQQLVGLTAEKGSDIKAIDQISTNLPYTTYEYLLQKGLRPDVLLKTALGISTTYYYGSMAHDTNVAEKKEKLVDLALSFKPDFSSITYLPSMPSVSLIGRMVDNGLSPDSALKMALSLNSNRYDSLSSRYVPDQDAQILQKELIKELLEKGADVNQAINQIIGFSGSFDMLELLSNNMDSLLIRTSHPLTPDNFLKIVLNSNVGSYEYDSSRYTIDPRKLELQGNLMQEALARGADINKVVKDIHPKIELLSNHKELIVKHLSPDTLLIWASAVSDNAYYNGDLATDEALQHENAVDHQNI